MGYRSRICSLRPDAKGQLVTGPTSTKPRRRRIDGCRRFAAVGIALVAAMISSAGCGPAAQDQQDLTADSSDGAVYAAFGDSYSAGEGTNSYLPGTAVPGVNVCHRSTLAYSQRLATQLDLGSNAFVACSGAVTADMFGPNNNHNKAPDGEVEPAQLCLSTPVAGIGPCGESRLAALGSDTQVVTVTIGGNDAGFAKVVESCLFGGSGRYRVGLPGRDCRDDPTTIERTARRIAALDGDGQDTSPYGSTIHPIASVLAAVHTVAPDAQVYVAGYPQVFQPTSTDDCMVGAVTEGASTTIPLKVTAADARAVDGAIQALNATIHQAARRAGPWVTYVDPMTTFTGHGLCTSATWINPVAASVTFDDDGRSISVASDSGSAHPTPQGQDDGYAAAFLEAGIGRSR
jgi:hypothetical protein